VCLNCVIFVIFCQSGDFEKKNILCFKKMQRLSFVFCINNFTVWNVTAHNSGEGPIVALFCMVM